MACVLNDKTALVLEIVKCIELKGIYTKQVVVALVICPLFRRHWV
jgi:hypothetical protein